MKLLLAGLLLTSLVVPSYAKDDDVGPMGPQGPQGIQGVAGPQGPIGLTGAKGATGNNGTNGSSGATGAAGSNGTAGAAGSNGVNGSNGHDGKVGATGAQGAAGLTGNDATAPEIDPRLDVEVREYDSKHWTLSSYASFGFQNTTSRYIVGQKLTLKLGQSYEERELEKIKKQLRDAQYAVKESLE